MTNSSPESANIDPDREVTDLGFRAKRVLLYIFFTCVAAELGFLILDYHVNYARMTEISAIRHLVNATREDAIGSWFSITQTAFVALSAWIVFLTARQQGRSRLVQVGWIVLTLFFLYMAFDDGSKFHERIGTAFRQMQESEGGNEGERIVDIFPSYTWQIVFLPLFGAMGLFMLVFLWQQFGDRLGRVMLLVGIACFVLAVGMDFIEGLDEDHRLNLWRILGERPAVDEFTRARFKRNGFTAIRHFGKTVEESIEMFGMTLLWIAILRHWMRSAPTIRVTFT